MKLLSLILSASLLLTVGAQTSRFCKDGVVRARKPLHKMSLTEWNKYVAAVKSIMSKSTSSSAISKYDTHAKIHVDQQALYHGYAPFFPFHRIYLREFELLLQAVDPTVTLPFWDWSLDSQAPETSFVFTNAYFGGNGQGSQMCVTTGQFSTWRPRYPSTHCLTRDWDGGNRISPWYSSEMINRAITNSNSYDSFRHAIEDTPHAAIHVNIGSDFSQMVSVNDPLFWVHHCYIDYIWDTWQWYHGDIWNTYGGRNSNGATARTTDTLRPYSDTVASVMDPYRMCYYYEESDNSPLVTRRALQARSPQSPGVNKAVKKTSKKASKKSASKKKGGVKKSKKSERRISGPRHDANYWRGVQERMSSLKHPEKVAVFDAKEVNKPATPDNSDRTDLIALRVPKQIPEEWLRRNNINVEECRAIERDYSGAYEDLNKIDGYVSPCSLIKREGQLKRLAKTEKKFTATYKGAHVECDLTGVSNPVDFVKQTINTVAGEDVTVNSSDEEKAAEAVAGKSVVLKST